MSAHAFKGFTDNLQIFQLSYCHLISELKTKHCWMLVYLATWVSGEMSVIRPKLSLIDKHQHIGCQSRVQWSLWQQQSRVYWVKHALISQPLIMSQKRQIINQNLSLNTENGSQLLEDSWFVWGKVSKKGVQNICE